MGEKNNNIIISLYFACSDRNAALGSAAEDDWLFHIEWIQQKLGVLPIWVIHRVEIILKRCSWFQQLCNCQTCSWRQLWEINFPAMLEWMSICFGMLRSPWLNNIAKSAWYCWKEISGAFWLIYSKIRPLFGTSDGTSSGQRDWSIVMKKRRMTEPGFTEKDAETLPSKWKQLLQLHFCLKEVKTPARASWLPHADRENTRLNCLSSKASAFKGSNHAPMTSLNTKTHRLALQQGCCFIKNRSEEKGQQAKRDSFCHHAATTSNKLAYYCQQARRRVKTTMAPPWCTAEFHPI